MLNFQYRFAAVVLLTLICAVLPAHDTRASASELTLHVGSGRITVEGLTPGKEALVFSVGRKAMSHYSRTVQVAEVLADSDGDGRVELDAETPLRSVWIAVDLQTARYTVGSPAEYSVHFSDALRGFSSTDGVLNGITASSVTASVVYVHPGGGAWRFHAVDGGRGDEDQQSNGLVVGSLAAAFEIIPGAGTHREFVPGGLLFLIAPDSLEVSVERLTPARLAEGRP